MGGNSNLDGDIGVAKTSVAVVENRPKSNFRKEGFDTLIDQKGYPVYIDKATKCPCADLKSREAIPQCRNCGGSGWIFYNRIDTKAIIHSMNKDTKFKEWSQELIGTGSFTTYSENRVTFMDRVTLKEGISIHSEILFISQYDDDSIWRARLRYPAISVQSLFLFQDPDQPLILLNLHQHYTLDNNQIFTLTTAGEALINGIQYPKFSIRYVHRPEYLVIDIPRHTMITYAKDPQDKIEGFLEMPIHAVIRLLHYSMDKDSNDGTYLFDNSFE